MLSTRTTRSVAILLIAHLAPLGLAQEEEEKTETRSLAKHLREQKSVLKEEKKSRLLFTFRDLKTNDEKRKTGGFSLNELYKKIANGKKLSTGERDFYQRRLRVLTASVNNNGRKPLHDQSVKYMVLFSAGNKRLKGYSGRSWISKTTRQSAWTSCRQSLTPSSLKSETRISRSAARFHW